MELNFKFSIFFLIGSLFLNAYKAVPIPYKDCGTIGVKINYFDVANCNTFPCIFTKNTNQTLLLSFTPSSNYGSLNNVLYGIIAGVKVPFPLADPSVCHLGVNCPMQQGNTYVQNLTLPILPVYPSVRL